MFVQKKVTSLLWATAAVILLPPLYILSLGPLFWLNNHGQAYQPQILVAAMKIYLIPMRFAWERGPEWWRHAFKAYLDLWQ